MRDQIIKAIAIVLLFFVTCAFLAVGGFLCWLSTKNATCSDWVYHGYTTDTCNFSYLDIYQNCNTSCACVSLSFQTTCLEYPSGASPGFILGGIACFIIGFVIIGIGIYLVIKHRYFCKLF